MKCPNCGEQTEGINHNGRGLRCTACWVLLSNELEPTILTFEPETLIVTDEPETPITTDHRPMPKRERKRKPRATAGVKADVASGEAVTISE